MARIALNDYLRQIDTLLDENRFSEAIAHCRHILQQFPRHVDTYRLMGKALLEQGNHDDAADIFQRVLSADPEDFVAHAGLSIVHKEKGNLPASIWHMERAFELDPYNAAVQVELKELYGRRDGAYPERVVLTRGALAHLYVRGGLYQQAISELRQLLSEEPERTDLHTLLAESLWRDDQRIDAVTICSNVLEKMPNCIKAIAILAEVWMLSGRHDEAQEYLQRLRGLTQLDKGQYDAETPVGRAFTADGVLDLPEQVSIEELDYLAGAVAGEETPDWVRELGLTEGTPEGVVEDVPAWLREIGGEDTFPFDEEPAAGPSGDTDNLDWLRQAAVAGADTTFPFDQSEARQGGFYDDATPATGQEAEWFADTGAGESAPDWLADSGDLAAEIAPAQPAGAMPDWLSEVTGDEEELAGFDFDAIQAAAAGDWMSDLVGEGVETPAETHWSDFLDKEPPAAPAAPQHTTEQAEWPSWIEDMDHPEAAALPAWMQADSERPPAEAGEAELPAWVEGIEGEEAAGEHDLPEWMQLEGESGGLAGLMGEPEAESEWPDWLSDVETEAAPPPSRLELAADTEAAADEGFPDWLTELEPSESPVARMDSPTDEGAPLDWLADLEQAGISVEPVDGETLSADEAWPDWMNEAEGELAAPSMLPEWLAADESQPANAETEGGVPDWLRELEQTKNTSGLLSLSESEISPTDEAWPDWLGTVEEEIAASGVEQPAAESEFDLGQAETDEPAAWPEWLNEMDEPAAPPVAAVLRPAAAEIEEEPLLTFDDEPVDAFDWLNALDEAEAGGEPLEPFAEAEAEAGVTGLAEDEWSGRPNASEQVEPAAALGDALLAADEDGMPDWLRLTEADSPAAMAEPEATAAADEDEWPAWLRAMEPAEAEAEAGAEASQPEEWSRWLDEQPVTSSALVTEMEPAAPQADDFDHVWPAEEEVAAESGSDWLAELEKIPELPGEELGPLPDWLRENEAATAAETAGSAAGDEATELPNWLQTDAVVEEQMIGGIDEPEKGQGEPPDDFDDAMAWLENLAAQQGAPLDELPTVQAADAAAAAGSDDDLPEWLQMERPDDATDEDADTWLQSANLVESPADWLDLAAPPAAESAAESWLAEGPATPTDDIPDWLRAQMPAGLEQQPAAASAADDLDWLDRMAGTGEGMEEQPTLSWDESDEEEVSFSEVAATLDEKETSLDWLAEMDEPAMAPAGLGEPVMAQDRAAFDFAEDPDDYDLFGDLLKTEDFQMEGGEGEPAGMAMADSGEEDAMTWLEGLAAGSTDEPVEAAPAFDEWPVLEGAAEDEPSLAGVELEPLNLDDDWLAESLPADALPDDVGTKVIVAEGEVFDQLPEEPEDAMAWLEQLAAQQGAPLEELPSLGMVSPVEEVDTDPLLSGEPAEEPLADFEFDLPAGDEDGMAWLDQLTAEPGSSLAEMAELGLTDEVETEPILPEAEVEITAADFVMEMPDDEEAAMAWLEQLAADQGAPIEELPSLSAAPAEAVEAEFVAPEAELAFVAADLVEPEAPAIVEPAADMEMAEDEAMAWLERLAAQQGAPLDELPSVSEADYATIEMSMEQPEMAAEDEMAADEGLQIPEDPDEAMAWLERLAAQQGAPLDELPSVSAEEYSTIEVNIEPAAEFEEAAIEWDDLPIDQLEVVEVETVVEVVEFDVAEAAAEGEPLVSFVNLDGEVPDDPDAALAWLEQLAAEHDEPAEAMLPLEVVEEPPTPAVPHSVLEARVEAEASLQAGEPAADLMGDMPEDPEAAMAWLEQLAARQGAPLAELKSVETMPAAEAEFAMPDWVAREMADAPAEAEAPAEAMPELDIFDAELADILAGSVGGNLLADLDDLPPVEEMEAADLFPESRAAEPATFEELDTAGIGEALPDWLSFAPAGESEGIDWIDSLVQSDVTGWLSAEEEVTGFHEDTPVMAAPEPEPTPLPRPVAPESPRPSRLEERPERVERAPALAGSLNQTQLAAARDSLSSGNFDSALENYSTLLDSGAGMNVIIADLESAVTRYNRQPLFTRLLGDAYMRNGQLQKALDMYRRALDQL